MTFTPKILRVFLSAALIVLAAPAFAKTGTTIGPAGCGLGNLVLGGRDMQIVAATLNGTGYQPSGITTGTSNCDAQGKAFAMLNYIQNNKQSLEKDIARGEGDSLGALAKIAGCSDSTSLSSELKGRYTEIFPSAEPTTVHVNDSIVRAINETPALKTSCAPLS